MIRVYRSNVLTSDQESFLSRLTGNSFYRSLEFLSLWRAMNGRTFFWLIEDDNALAGVLPGVEFGSGWFKRFQSGPDGCYGGLVVDSDCKGSSELILKSLASSLKKEKYAKLIINDFFHTLDNIEHLISSRQSTMVADISSPNWQPHQSVTRGANKALREGIKVVEFNMADHFESFMTLMESTERRHRRQPKYNREFYNSLALLAQKDRRVRWLWCEHEKTPVASHIYFIEGDSLIYWQGYFDKGFSFLHPNQFMLHQMATEMASKGIKYLNLGSSPTEAGGLIQFKERFGARVRDYPCYHLSNILGKFL